MAYIYIVTDCEFDGSIPGKHSMLSFGSVAMSERGEVVGEFEGVLKTLDEATSDAATMEFWSKHPAAWTAATENAQPANLVIDRFVMWVRSLGKQAIFAAHPVALDGPWLDYYLKRFTGRPLFEGPWIADRLFRSPPLCIMSMVAGKTGREYPDCDVEFYPPEWLGSVEHTHRAIDDARGYANLLRFVIEGR